MCSYTILCLDIANTWKASSVVAKHMQHSQMRNRPTVYVLRNCTCLTLMCHWRATLNRQCSCSGAPVSRREAQTPHVLTMTSFIRNPPLWHHATSWKHQNELDTQQSQVPPLSRLVRDLGESPRPPPFSFDYPKTAAQTPAPYSHLH